MVKYKYGMRFLLFMKGVINMNLSFIADLIQIITFAVAVIVFIAASISVKLRAWLKSIFKECLYELFARDNDESNTPKIY